MFSDIVTCGYCQDVARRIRKGEKIFYSRYKKLNIDDRIDSNFDLFQVDGRSFYGSEKIDEKKYLLIIDILSTLP